jgi:hypothetical protein
VQPQLVGAAHLLAALAAHERRQAAFGRGCRASSPLLGGRGLPPAARRVPPQQVLVQRRERVERRVAVAAPHAPATSTNASVNPKPLILFTHTHTHNIDHYGYANLQLFFMQNSRLFWTLFDLKIASFFHDFITFLKAQFQLILEAEVVKSSSLYNDNFLSIKNCLFYLYT